MSYVHFPVQDVKSAKDIEIDGLLPEIIQYLIKTNPTLAKYIQYLYKRSLQEHNPKIENYLRGITKRNAGGIVSLTANLFLTDTFGNDKKLDFINFEGADATGKGTQSRLLKKFFDSIQIESPLYQIPNYQLPHGKILKSYLSSEENLFNVLDGLEVNTEETLVQEVKELLKEKSKIVEVARNFAINRLETFNGINLIGTGNTFINGIKPDDDYLLNYTPVIESKGSRGPSILDRWSDSSIAFSTAKLQEFYSKLIKIKKVHGDRPLTKNESDCMDLIDKLLKNSNIEHKLLIEYVNYLEYTLFNLPRPNVTIICVAPMEVINARIKKRRACEKQSKSNDVFQQDKHEDDKSLLSRVMDVYRNYPDLWKEYEVDIDPSQNRQEYIISESVGTEEEIHFDILWNLSKN